MKSRLLDRLLLSAHVRSVEQLGPRIRRITVTGPELAGLTWTPGQHVRIQVGAGPVDWLIGTLRTYSVWNYHDQTIELIAYDHSDGPGAHWARTTRPGEELRLMKPEGRFTTTAHAGYHLFAGEETAQVSYGPMLRALPAGTRVFGCLEVDNPDERLDLGEHPDWTVHWSYRHGRSAASAHTLVDTVRNLDLPAEPGTAYLAGEARTIQLVRTHLVQERHWPRRNIHTKPFWTPGRRGLE